MCTHIHYPRSPVPSALFCVVYSPTLLICLLCCSLEWEEKLKRRKREGETKEGRGEEWRRTWRGREVGGGEHRGRGRER